ncbi:ESCRT-II complex subunit VPS36 [Paragonimus heterotremus]|uniref:Vacuolar protein-sorting-associated protein 36 n=1 Tax=Paragonimus heterotremus TaxID=100268 RepID=A0A8J4T3G0_9TREM|nr:ESCRT-II complex subunit VPS36 [Paragonimus heterotremus]
MLSKLTGLSSNLLFSQRCTDDWDHLKPIDTCLCMNSRPFLPIEPFHVTEFSNMDRLRWCSADIEHRGFGGCSGADEEALVLQQYGVRLYDGPERTAFEDGVIKLTTHRLLWIPRHNSADSCIALPLAAIINVRFEEGGGILRGRTPKVVLRLLTAPALKNVLASLSHQSPWMDRWLTNEGCSYAVVEHSNENHIKLGFARTGEKEFLRALEETLKAKVWAASLNIQSNRSSSRSFGGVGIGAIQRQQAARAGATDAKLEEAFDDLKKLMSHAGEMVTLSRTLARRTREMKRQESRTTANSPN